jgi:nucleotide-binding universal stress UspA family protein
MFPPHRILAAVDFSDCSRVALNAAGRLAGQCSAELIVLHALDPLLADAARAVGVNLAADTSAELGRFVHTAVASRDPARTFVVAGNAADVICQIAERESADVVVLGAHGMSGVAHALFGSTTERVLRHSPVSLFIVPATWTAPDPIATNLAGVGPIIVGLDLTSGAAAAAVAASQLACVLKTRLEVMHVVAPIAAPVRWTAHAERAVHDATLHAQAELALVTKARRPDVPTTIRVDVGDVARTLAYAAAPHGETRPILVLGRDVATPRGAAPGAIAYRVLMQAATPVLVYLPMD